MKCSSKIERGKDLIVILGFSETIDQLAMAVYKWSCAKEGG